MLEQAAPYLQRKIVSLARSQGSKGSKHVSQSSRLAAKLLAARRNKRTSSIPLIRKTTNLQAENRK